MIANDFNFEAKRITKKFLSPGFCWNFIRNTIEYLNKDKDGHAIPEWIFDEQKLIILRLPFLESNEKFTKSLLWKKSSIYFQIINVNSTLFGIVEILDDCLKTLILTN